MLRTLIALALVLVSVLPGSAVTLEGRVTAAASGDALRLANVGTKSSLQRAVTDDEGRFTLEVDGLPVTLIVRYIGYRTEEIEVRNDSFLEVALQDARVDAEETMVVGSRFAPRTVITSPVPIDNVGRDELAATGQLTFDKMLTYSVPSYNSTQQTISDATAHFDPADLRGLGPSRTLVLINGKRKNASALVFINDTPGKGEVGVDMKSIPAAAVERVEVLRDGASAQYGSDAIAGVINVILRDDVETTRITGFGGGTMVENDGGNYGYSVNTGFSLPQNGYVHIAHSFTDQNETNRAGRPGEDALFGVTADDPVFGSWLAANPDLGMHVGLPNMRTSDVFLNGKLPLQANAEIYAFGGVQYRKGLSYALYRAPYWIPDPFFIYHQPGEEYGGFQPTFETNVFDKTVAAGVRGQTQGWDYDVSHIYGSNRVDYSVDNSLNTDLGAQSPTFFRSGGYEFKSNVTNVDLSRQVLRARINVGSEFRTENFIARAGEEDSYFGSGTQSFPGLQPQNEADAFRNNVGVYGDLAVDVTDDLLIGGAGRYENYSDFGDATTWKANGRFKFLEDRASVRASASTGFRAPSLHQIHLSIVQTLVSGGTVSNQGTFDNLSPVLRQLEVPQLKEEKARNYTGGVAVRPIDGLYFSLDYYYVEVDDRVVYSSSIASDDTTTTVGMILNDNDITSLKFFTNAVDTKTQGVDFVGTYAVAAGPGNLAINLSANFNDTDIRGQIDTPAPIAESGVDIFDRKEQSRILTARPSDKVLLGVSYGMGGWRATLNNTRFGEVAWKHATDPAKDQTFGAKVITDVYADYQWKHIVVSGGIQNLFDVYPDEIDNKGDVLTDLGGRFVYPWEVNQFGFAGMTGIVKVGVTF